MNLHEVLKSDGVTSGVMWFRPVGYSGQAYTIKDGMTVLVPTSRGGNTFMTASVGWLTAEWETVHPSTVLRERES